MTKAQGMWVYGLSRLEFCVMTSDIQRCVALVASTKRWRLTTLFPSLTAVASAIRDANGISCCSMTKANHLICFKGYVKRQRPVFHRCSETLTLSFLLGFGQAMLVQSDGGDQTLTIVQPIRNSDTAPSVPPPAVPLDGRCS